MLSGHFVHFLHESLHASSVKEERTGEWCGGGGEGEGRGGGRKCSNGDDSTLVEVIGIFVGCKSSHLMHGVAHTLPNAECTNCTPHPTPLSHHPHPIPAAVFRNVTSPLLLWSVSVLTCREETTPTFSSPLS